MNKYPSIIKLSNAFKPVFPNHKIEYCNDNGNERGAEEQGNKVNPMKLWGTVDITKIIKSYR